MNLARESVVELVDSGRKRGGVSAFLAASAPRLSSGASSAFFCLKEPSELLK